MKKSLLRLMAVGIVSYALANVDDKIKEAVEAGTIDNDVIKPNRFFKLEKHLNKGFAGNRLEDRQDIVASVSSAAAAVQLMLTGYVALNNKSFLFNAANALMLAGAISNTKDRLTRRYVVDYIRIKGKIYNLSDFYIFAGAFLDLLYASGTFE